MANTYTALHYHVVFSTKNREPWISASAQEDVWAYLGGIARANDIRLLTVGGMEDHVHLLLGLNAAQSVAKCVQLLKGGS